MISYYSELLPSPQPLLILCISSYIYKQYIINLFTNVSPHTTGTECWRREMSRNKHVQVLYDQEHFDS